MPTSAVVRAANSTTIAALAEQLREGPLTCLATLHVRIRALAPTGEVSDSDRLEHSGDPEQLEEMLRLAQCAMRQFHELTQELLRLVERAAERSMVSH
jgi:hypothetical protein